MVNFCFYLETSSYNYYEMKENVSEDLMAAFVKQHLNPINQVQSSQEARTFCLYLSLVGFMVKQQFNYDVKLFEHCLNRLVPNFNLIYSNWGVKEQLVNNNLLQLNQFFNKCTNQFKQTQDYFQDYNSMVDNIIQISPPNKTREKENK